MAVLIFKKFRTAARRFRINLQFRRKSTKELQKDLEDLTSGMQGYKARNKAGMQSKLLKQETLIIEALRQRGAKLDNQ
ncbi:MAG: hypothetical protein J4415_03720 [Candidatus Diapherotrites archaeon]|uniref:Uncharacterized protein n=1 Tax=Candidatus Iainarchaeum sp. TaxID=3101447 RepID=A0A8T4KUB1_9ARCH|nr:hypothetical protein [Candidatus Diapherotrites archaeon]